jgi:hypothetical protein
MSDGGTPQPEAHRDSGNGGRTWVDLIKALALPLVTLVLGYWFNSSLNERQQVESNIRLYAEMMGRREEADSNLRKDMFNSILTTFLARDPSQRQSSEELIRQQILSLELLAYNFHESLDIGPLFKDVQRRITVEERRPGVPGDGEDRTTNEELRGRLESVALQVIEHQLTALSDAGMIERGDALPEKINELQSYIMFGTRTVPDPDTKPGEGPARVCLFMNANDGSVRYRQFRIELLRYDEPTREVLVHLYVSQPLTEQECQQPTLDLQAKREIDTNFLVGLFDFPMIDNTRLSGGERTAVSLTALNPSVLSVALTYFPASRASLKDKPYYDEVIRDLVRNRQSSSPLR